MIIKSIRELTLVMDMLNSGVFRSHVTPYKNDFARWIYDVFGLSDLSEQLGSVKSKEETARILKAYVKGNQKIMTNKMVSNAASEAEHQTVVKKQDPQKPAPAQQTTKKAARVYKWSSGSSDQNKDKKPELREAKAKKEVKKPELQTNSPKVASDADAYFDENPLIMSQVVESKKKKLNFEMLEPISYDQNEPAPKSIELFKDTYAKIYSRMSELRKSGFDTTLAEAMVFRIPAKIKVYEASQSHKDAVVVKRYINEAIEELNSIPNV